MNYHGQQTLKFISMAVGKVLFYAALIGQLIKVNFSNTTVGYKYFQIFALIIELGY